MFKLYQRMTRQNKVLIICLLSSILSLSTSSVFARSFFDYFQGDDRYDDRNNDDRYDDRRSRRDRRYNDRYNDRYYDNRYYDDDRYRYRRHKKSKQQNQPGVGNQPPGQQPQQGTLPNGQMAPNGAVQGGPNTSVAPPLTGTSTGLPTATTPQKPILWGPLSQKVDILIQQYIPNTHVGLVVQEAKSGRLLYDKNSNEAFLPASITKLFTGAASLFIMGGDYRYVTSIKFNPKLRSHETLNGDLYIQFKGDPSLTTKDLKDLIHALKAAGIKNIKGDVIIDNQYFQGPHYATGWVWNSMNWYFSPPITTIILNENKIKLQITSGKAPGEKAVIALDKGEPTAINILQDILSVTAEEAENDCSLAIKLDERNDAAFSGCWPVNDKPESLKIAVHNPDELAKKIIYEALEQEKMTLSGNIILGFAPESFKVFVSHQSEPLSTLLTTMMQESNNIYAESFTKTMGYLIFNKGNFQSGVRAIQEVLAKETKINFKDMRLRDGSGLSRYNLIKPKQIMSLLSTMFKNSNFKSTYFESFPVAGESGSLKDRFKSDTLKGKIVAKTGSMLGVSALAGYVKPAKGEERLFCIMIDDALLDPAKLKQFENELCEVLLNS